MRGAGRGRARGGVCLPGGWCMVLLPCSGEALRGKQGCRCAFLRGETLFALETVFFLPMLLFKRRRDMNSALFHAIARSLCVFPPRTESTHRQSRKPVVSHTPPLSCFQTDQRQERLCVHFLPHVWQTTRIQGRSRAISFCCHALTRKSLVGAKLRTKIEAYKTPTIWSNSRAS